jgi:tRNA (cmo5U34)-methyltransferase
LPADGDADAPADASVGGGGRQRVPEPMVMDEPQAAAAFDRAGSGDGPLVPQYELCARGMSHLLAAGGTVVDLGSGSGRFLAYFAQRRPDAQVIGVELSGPMAELGKRMLFAEGLGQRVRLIEADMTACADVVPAQVDLLSCMLALHQLPSEVELLQALEQVAAIRERTGCAVWLWDLVRLDDDEAIKQWMAQASDADPLFHRDALASEAAAWTHDELTQALAQTGLDDLHHGISRPPLLQVHWALAREPERAGQKGVWHEVAMSSALRQRVIGLRLGFSGLR